MTQREIVVRKGKKETRFEPGSLKGLSFQQGELCLHRNVEHGNAHIQGLYTLPRAEVGNASAFLTLASEQLQLPILTG